MKPIINIHELPEIQNMAKGPYADRFSPISRHIGAEKLAYSLSVVPPGKKMCPFHNHRVLEEMFFIISGKGTLRFGDREYPVRPHDMIACPPGGREVAHQLINSGEEDLVYLCLSTNESQDICEYPDSDKVMCTTRQQDGVGLRHVFKVDAQTDYFDGELD